MKTLYVGCALRGAPPEFVAGVLELKSSLEDSFEILHFVGLGTDIADRVIYETDIAMAVNADLMLAIADLPSAGLGIELAKRAERGGKTVVAHSSKNRISSMVLGLVEVTSAFTSFQYEDFAEVCDHLRTFA